MWLFLHAVPAPTWRSRAPAATVLAVEGRALWHIAFVDAVLILYYITTTVKTQPLCGVIPRLRMPGTVPGGYPEYPDPLRGDFLTVVMRLYLACTRFA